ncbi:hypothetical protein FRC06_010724, partial [Ceratobasidium sp. 370]
LKDEPVLNPSAMFTCDGNESMKRVANVSVSDSRTFEHYYFLDNDYIDRFKNETQRRKNSGKTSINEAPGDLRHGETSRGLIASGSEVVKDKNTPFEDMRRSGELSKYGLAAVDRLIRIFGDDILIGYDIGCSLLKTRYKKALDIIATLPKEIEKIWPKKTSDDWRAMFEKERECCKTLKAPNPESTFAMRYLKSLRVLAEKEKIFLEVFSVTGDHMTPAQMDTYHKLAVNTRKLEA